MYDVIVIGTGGIGSAALYELARRGVSVLGLDRFPPGHDRGSSHGQTRIIRRSYFEHHDYVPLLNLAYELWDELCDESGQPLLQRTGLVYIGDASDPAIMGVQQSARDYRLQVEPVPAADAEKRFPGFMVPAGLTVLYEPDAGYLRVEAAVKASIAQAERLGAETIHGCQVVQWSATDTGVAVETTAGRIEARNLVITAGCWANSLLLELKISLTVVRKHLHWFATTNGQYEQSAGCPCFFHALSDGYFYGFPQVDGSGLKVSEHSGGTPIDDPLTDDRSPDPADSERVASFLTEYLPGVSSKRLRHEVCFYTMTPDVHFVIDRHPDYANVVFAAGLSGHGFKFAPAIGRLLTEMTVDGECSLDIDFLSLRRPGLTLS